MHEAIKVITIGNKAIPFTHSNIISLLAKYIIVNATIRIIYTIPITTFETTKNLTIGDLFFL